MIVHQMAPNAVKAFSYNFSLHL